MLQRLFELATRLVLECRSPVLLAGLLLRLVAALSRTRPRTEASPRALLASADSQHDGVAEAFRKRFGSTGDVIAIIVEAPGDVLQRAPLGYLHVLGEEMAKLPGVERVDGIARLHSRASP